MTFTSLETLFMAAFLSSIVGIIVRIKSVSPSECRNTQGRLVAVIEGLQTSNNIQFRMLRALVAHLDLPAEVRVSILNMGPASPFKE